MTEVRKKQILLVGSFLLFPAPSLLPSILSFFGIQFNIWWFFVSFFLFFGEVGLILLVLIKLKQSLEFGMRKKNIDNFLPIIMPAETKDEERVIYEIPILSVEEFLSHAKNNPTDFIQYCEVIILEDGRIVKVRPSHTMVIHSIVRQRMASSDFDFKRTVNHNQPNSDFDFSITFYEEELLYYSRAVSVWYEGQRCYSLSSLTKEQLLTLERLADAGLIQKNLSELSEPVRRNFEERIDFE